MDIGPAGCSWKKELDQNKIKGKTGCIIENIRLVFPYALKAVYHGQEYMEEHCEVRLGDEKTSSWNMDDVDSVGVRRQVDIESLMNS